MKEPDIEEQIYRYIVDYYKTVDRYPTIRDIHNIFRGSCPSEISKYIRQLSVKKLVEIDYRHMITSCDLPHKPLYGKKESCNPCS